VEANATTKRKGAAVDLSTEFAEIGMITTIHFSSSDHGTGNVDGHPAARS
jgi:hypothetical protein